MLLRNLFSFYLLSLLFFLSFLLPPTQFVCWLQKIILCIVSVSWVRNLVGVAHPVATSRGRPLASPSTAPVKWLKAPSRILWEVLKLPLRDHRSPLHSSVASLPLLSRLPPLRQSLRPLPLTLPPGLLTDKTLSLQSCQLSVYGADCFWRSGGNRE